jgi:hypothetical protein
MNGKVSKRRDWFCKMIQDEIELEKLKHQNYLIETEKMRLELKKMNHSQALENKIEIKK